MPIPLDDGSGEQNHKPYVDTQGGSGEQEVQVYVNEQDGNGEQLVYEPSDLPALPTIEDWERPSPLDEYSTVNGSAAVSSTRAYNGSQSLKFTDAGQYIYSAPGDGLGDYPEPGDRFQTFHWTTDASQYGVFELQFGGTDRDNCYVIQFNWDTGDLYIAKNENGSISALANVNVYGDGDTSIETWTGMDVDWGTNGGISVELYQGATTLDTVSTTDTTYTSRGGWGYEWFNASSNTPCYVDYTRLNY